MPVFKGSPGESRVFSSSVGEKQVFLWFVNTGGMLGVYSPMHRTESVWCPHCDHEHECEVISDEYEDYLDVPGLCEACGEGLIGGDSSYREDFHADC